MILIVHALLLCTHLMIKPLYSRNMRSHLHKNKNGYDWLLMFCTVPAGILIRVVTLNSTPRSA